MNDIRDKEDVKIFVDAFYTKVRIDQLLGPIFAAKIPNDSWEPHLERMYSFWYTVLFAARDYSGNPFSKHASLPIQKNHFERWVGLFLETIDENFQGIRAEDAKMRAIKMGQLFQSKLEYIQANQKFKSLEKDFDSKK